MKDEFGFSNDDSARGCERAADLVAYLYGEAAPDEARSFVSHLDACAVCRDEAAAFKSVRAEVGALRAEGLSAAPNLNVAAAFADALRNTERPARRRSAVAALREFFSLSPLWLQFGSVTAALVVCALAALTFARTEVRWDDGGLAIRSGVPAQVVEKRVEVPAPGTYTEQQVNEIAEQRARQALAEYQAGVSDQPASQVANDDAVENERAVPVTVSDKQQTPRGQLVKQPRQRRNLRQNLEYEPEEDELPGLYDLLREAN